MDLSSKMEELFSEIHQKQNQRNSQLMGLVSELKPYMNDIGDATVLVPLISKYMDIAVKNDDILIKLANLVSKAANAGSNDDGFGLSEEERNSLLSELDSLNKDTDG